MKKIISLVLIQAFLMTPMYGWSASSTEIGKGSVTNFDHKSVPGHINDLDCQNHYTDETEQKFESIKSKEQIWQTLGNIGYIAGLIVSVASPLYCKEMTQGEVWDPWPAVAGGLYGLVRMKTTTQKHNQQSVQVNDRTIAQAESSHEIMTAANNLAAKQAIAESMDSTVEQYQAVWEPTRSQIDKMNKTITDYTILTVAYGVAAVIAAVELVLGICGTYCGTEGVSDFDCSKNQKLSNGIKKVTSSELFKVFGVGSLMSGILIKSVNYTPIKQNNFNKNYYSKFVCKPDNNKDYEELFVSETVIEKAINLFISKVHASVNPTNSGGIEIEPGDVSDQFGNHLNKDGIIKTKDQIADNVKTQDEITSPLYQSVITRIILWGAMTGLTATRMSNAKKERKILINNMKKLGHNYCKMARLAKGSYKVPQVQDDDAEQPVCLVSTSSGYTYDTQCLCAQSNSCTTISLPGMNKLPKQYHSDWRMMASLANNTARGKRPSSNINWSSKAKDYQKKLDKLLDKINDKRVAAGKKPINFQQQIQKAQAKLSKALGMKTSKEEKKVTKTEKKSTRYTASYNSSPVQQKSAGKKSGWADIDWGDDEKEEGLEDEAGRDPADGLDAYEIDENDVNLNSGASIFEQISLRYKRSYNKVLD